MSTTQSTHQPLIFAHRGSTLLAPENTQAAFDLALEFKADVLETDVRLSADGVVVVTHDETLDRTTDGRGRVVEHRWEALKTLNAAIHFRAINGEPYNATPQRLLRLDELFECYPHVGINIDIKDNSLDAADAVAAVLARIPNKQKQWVNVGSFHANVIRHFRSIAPHVSTAATRQEVAKLVFRRAGSIKPDYQILQIPQTYFGIRLNRSQFINKVHQLQRSIVYWTINDSQAMHWLLTRGCDGIVTDRPDLALQVFKAHGLK